MAVSIPAGFALVTHEHRNVGNTRPAFVTYGISTTGSVGSDDPSHLHAVWAAGPVTDMAATTSHITTTVIKGPRPTGATVSYTQVIAGGGLAQGAGPQEAWLGIKQTGVGGRKFKGRFYLPGVPEANVNSGGFLTGSEPADMQAQVDEWLAALAADELGPYLLHEDVGTDPTLIVTVSVETLIATQRRRLRR
jgi:hypothetical protein